MKNNDIDLIRDLLLQAQNIATRNGIKNLFYNEMYVELFIANILKHEYNNNTQGGDATEEINGVKYPTEYKTINIFGKDKVTGSYQFHWLSDAKINKYKETKNMYFCIRDGINILEIYQVKTDKVMPLLESKKSGDDSINGHAGISPKAAVTKYGAVKVYDSKNPAILPQ